MIREHRIVSLTATKLNKDQGLRLAAGLTWVGQRKRAVNESCQGYFGRISALSCKTPEIFTPLNKAVIKPHLEQIA